MRLQPFPYHFITIVDQKAPACTVICGGRDYPFHKCHPSHPSLLPLDSLSRSTAVQQLMPPIPSITACFCFSSLLLSIVQVVTHPPPPLSDPKEIPNGGTKTIACQDTSPIHWQIPIRTSTLTLANHLSKWVAEILLRYQDLSSLTSHKDPESLINQPTNPTTNYTTWKRAEQMLLRSQTKPTLCVYICAYAVPLHPPPASRGTKYP